MSFDPYAPPTAQAGGPAGGGGGRVHLAGSDLVIEKTAALPPICIKCGNRSDVRSVAKKFQWSPTWARLMIVFCTIGGIIAMLVTQKKAELLLPLCGPCDARWKAARNATIVGVVVIVAAFLGARLSDDPSVFGVAVLGGIAVFVALMVAYVRPRVITVTKIDDAAVYCRGFSPDAAREMTGYQTST